MQQSLYFWCLHSGEVELVVEIEGNLMVHPYEQCQVVVGALKKNVIGKCDGGVMQEVLFVEVTFQ